MIDLNKYYISTTYQGASGGSEGRSGFVPKALSAEELKFLRGDGTWQTVNTDLGDIPSLSANWNSTYTTVQSNSSLWNQSNIAGYKSLSAGETVLDVGLYNIFYTVVTGSNIYTFANFTTGSTISFYLSANHSLGYRQYFPINTIIHTGEANAVWTYENCITKITFEYINNQYIGIANTIQTNIPSISALGFLMRDGVIGFLLQQNNDKLILET
jgi:hypothetical protein